MFDSTQHLQALLSASSPLPMQSRCLGSVGGSDCYCKSNEQPEGDSLAIEASSVATLRACNTVTEQLCTRTLYVKRIVRLFTNIRGCRYISLSPALSLASNQVQTWQKVPNPTRNVALPTGVVPAAAVAAGICTLWMAPTSRPAVLSLLSTNAALTLFKDFLAKYPISTSSSLLNCSCSWRPVGGYSRRGSSTRRATSVLT
ncbi:hypothetical protein GQ600_25729 [Phytophthora cactorum]|nr:hypothetical protein GQ600_25729 [Phytophthora cactorum]